MFIIAAARAQYHLPILSPVALAWILGYSFAKRFTHWPHLWLGLSLAMAPVAVACGGGTLERSVWLLLAVTLAVVTWVAGFDVFYALPDEGFDRDAGLSSARDRGSAQRRAILFAQIAARAYYSSVGALRLGRRVRTLVFCRCGLRPPRSSSTNTNSSAPAICRGSTRPSSP